MFSPETSINQEPTSVPLSYISSSSETRREESFKVKVAPSIDFDSVFDQPVLSWSLHQATNIEDESYMVIHFFYIPLLKATNSPPTKGVKISIPLSVIKDGKEEGLTQTIVGYVKELEFSMSSGNYSFSLTLITRKISMSTEKELLVENPTLWNVFNSINRDLELGMNVDIDAQLPWITSDRFHISGGQDLLDYLTDSLKNKYRWWIDMFNTIHATSLFGNSSTPEEIDFTVVSKIMDSFSCKSFGSYKHKESFSVVKIGTPTTATATPSTDITYKEDPTSRTVITRHKSESSQEINPAISQQNQFVPVGEVYISFIGNFWYLSGINYRLINFPIGNGNYILKAVDLSFDGSYSTKLTLETNREPFPGSTNYFERVNLPVKKDAR
jgi:hypothetical protein